MTRPCTRRWTSRISRWRSTAEASCGCCDRIVRSSDASRDSGRVPRAARARGISHREIISRVRILMVASEVHPFAKTGGLADVLGALPRRIGKAGTPRRCRDAALSRDQGRVPDRSHQRLTRRAGRSWWTCPPSSNTVSASSSSRTPDTTSVTTCTARHRATFQTIPSASRF